MCALEYLKAHGDGKTRMLSILWFDFIITLVTIEYVLQSLLPRQHFYKPIKKCDLMEAAKETVSVISRLRERADSEVWNSGTYIIWRRCGTGNNIPSSTEQAVLENKDTAKMFPLTHLVSTGRGQCTNHSWTTCCSRSLHGLKIATWLSTSHRNNWWV